MIKGQRIYLRPVAMRDVDIVLRWENNPEFWEVSSTPGPFTRSEIAEFIRSSVNVFQQNQMRWMICLNDDSPIGALDLFDFDQKEKSAGIGILIANGDDRKKGYANEALNEFIKFANNTLRFKKLHCIIYLDNEDSIKLFERNRFKTTGLSYFKEKKVYRYYLELS